nr:adenylate/guanylate cyclase domain-containing protein [Nocardioides zeae]
MATHDGRVTILFSDIEGSTTLNDRLGDRAWVRLLARHDEVVRRAVEAHAGQVVKTQGDGFMVAFGPAADAVGAALAVQHDLAGWRAEPRVRVRIGIHRGSVLHRDNDLFGRNVAYAARVASLADGGEVLVSEAVADALDADERATLLDPEGSREVELRGITGTQVVHRLVPPTVAG